MYVQFHCCVRNVRKYSNSRSFKKCKDILEMLFRVCEIHIFDFVYPLKYK